MTWQKIKWFAASIAAVVMAVLGFLYGKKTTAVVRAKVRSNDSKDRVLGMEIAREQVRAARGHTDEQVAKHMAKADALKESREKLEEKRLRLVREAPEVSDVELARRHNAARDRS